MVETVLVGVLTALTLIFFFRWRDEKRKGEAWKKALGFAQQEVARCKKEIQQWAVIADCTGSRLAETELRLPNINDLLGKSD
jgi:hypothetical protein